MPSPRACSTGPRAHSATGHSPADVVSHPPRGARCVCGCGFGYTYHGHHQTRAQSDWHRGSRSVNTTTRNADGQPTIAELSWPYAAWRCRRRPFTALRGPAEPDGDCGGVILLSLQRLSSRTSVSRRALGELGRGRGLWRQRTAAAPGVVFRSQAVGAGDFEECAAAVWVVSDALELCHGGPGTLRATTAHGFG